MSSSPGSLNEPVTVTEPFSSIDEALSDRGATVGATLSTVTVAVLVTKAGPKVKVKVDRTITQGHGAKAVVKVTAPDGIVVTGKVKLVVKGTDTVLRAKVVGGKAVFDLPKFTQAGKVTLRAVYLGSDLLTKISKKVGITVTT